MDNFFHKRIAYKQRLHHYDRRAFWQVRKLNRTVWRKVYQWARRGYKMLHGVTATVTEEGHKRWVTVHVIMTLMPEEGWHPCQPRTSRKSHHARHHVQAVLPAS